MSINKKLILLNSIVIIIVVLISVITMSLSFDNEDRKAQEETLINTVSKNANNLVNDNGIVYVDDDFQFINDGVYLSIYNSNFELINGVFPLNSNPSNSINPSQIQTYKIDGDTYLIYDYTVKLNGRSDIYLRGILKESNSIHQTILIVSLILIPLLALLGIVASNLVSKHATKPLYQISDEVLKIKNSNDLNLRININTKDPDIILLVNSYNQMLDSVENLFKKEEEFTSNVSHELRTPIAVILSEVEYAKEIDNIKDKDLSLDIILRNTYKLKNIVEELLSYSRLNDKSKIEFKDISLSDITNEINLTENTKNIKLIKDIDSDIILNLNETLYYRLVDNLVDNAYKYNKENGIITLKLKKNIDNIILTVTDTGKGIKEEDIDKIFDRFYKSDESRHSEGLGLGLSFVKEIINIFNAKINVKSEVNKGTTFEIIFNINS